MATIDAYVPRKPPQQASPQVRHYLDEETQQLALRINELIEENESLKARVDALENP